MDTASRSPICFRSFTTEEDKVSPPTDFPSSAPAVLSRVLLFGENCFLIFTEIIAMYKYLSVYIRAKYLLVTDISSKNKMQGKCKIIEVKLKFRSQTKLVKFLFCTTASVKSSRKMAMWEEVNVNEKYTRNYYWVVCKLAFLLQLATDRDDNFLLSLVICNLSE